MGAAHSQTVTARSNVQPDGLGPIHHDMVDVPCGWALAAYAPNLLTGRNNVRSSRGLLPEQPGRLAPAPPCGHAPEAGQQPQGRGAHQPCSLARNRRANSSEEEVADCPSSNRLTKHETLRFPVWAPRIVAHWLGFLVGITHSMRLSGRNHASWYSPASPDESRWLTRGR